MGSTYANDWVRAARRAALVGAAAAASGCIGIPTASLPEPPPLAGVSASELAAAPAPRPVDEVLAVNDDMRRFVDDYVSHHADPDRRIRQLTSAVLHPGTLGVTYRDMRTRTASETFDTANGNCLSLSLLFVALAREAGIEAQFYEVNVVPEWTLAGDVVMTTRHVNVGGRIGGNMTYVMDFSPYVVRREIGRRRMSDTEAVAQYYNNIGAGHLARGDLVAAYRQFTAGLSLAPRVSFLWSNLSVVYSRHGQLDAAETMLEAAVALDPRNTSAMSNLARLLRLRGEHERAAELSRRIERVQRDNPYYQFALGERHLAQSRYAAALEQLQRAIELEPREPLFYSKAARAAAALDRAELAQNYDLVAARLDKAAQRKRREALGF